MRNILLIAAYEVRMRIRDTRFWVVVGMLVFFALLPNLLLWLAPSKEELYKIWTLSDWMPSPTENFMFIPAQADLDRLKSTLADKEVILVLQKDSCTVYTREPLSSEMKNKLQLHLQEEIRTKHIQELNLSPEKWEWLHTTPQIYIQSSSSARSATAQGIAQVIGFVLFFFLVLYGDMIFQSVLEEKTNRLAEYLLTVLRPYQLLTGKVVGSLGVMSLQILLSVALIVGIQVAVILWAPIPSFSAQGQTDISPHQAQQIVQFLLELPWKWILLFFLGGVGAYVFLYAAAAAASQSPTETSSFQQVLVFVPLGSIVLTVLSGILSDAPHNPLLVFLSYLPLTSPIAMVMRMTINAIPMWEKLLSLGLLAGFMGFSVWASEKIYCQSLLVYEKLSLKQIWHILRS
ncbi:MAG: ABC transporter permease [Bacteroidia bacterium]